MHKCLNDDQASRTGGGLHLGLGLGAGLDLLNLLACAIGSLARWGGSALRQHMFAGTGLNFRLIGSGTL